MGVRVSIQEADLAPTGHSRPGQYAINVFNLAVVDSMEENQGCRVSCEPSYIRMRVQESCPVVSQPSAHAKLGRASCRLFMMLALKQHTRPLASL